MIDTPGVVDDEGLAIECLQIVLTELRRVDDQSLEGSFRSLEMTLENGLREMQETWQEIGAGFERIEAGTGRIEAQLEKIEKDIIDMRTVLRKDIARSSRKI